MFKNKFSYNPQLGWFCSNPKYLKQKKEDFLEMLQDKNTFRWVIKNKNGNVVGYFGADWSKSELWARRGGVEIILDQKIQGRGISKIAYLLMLEWLCKNKVDILLGGTSQGPIMHLGKKMKRWVDLYMLRKPDRS